MPTDDGEAEDSESGSRGRRPRLVVSLAPCIPNWDDRPPHRQLRRQDCLECRLQVCMSGKRGPPHPVRKPVCFAKLLLSEDSDGKGVCTPCSPSPIPSTSPVCLHPPPCYITSIAWISNVFSDACPATVLLSTLSFLDLNKICVVHNLGLQVHIPSIVLSVPICL